jgi:hypothetical protein
MLARTGMLLGTLAAGSVLAGLAPTRVWALELSALPESQAQTTLAFARTLYPHATLPDAVYALVVKALDGKAKGDPKTAALIADGCGSLDHAAGGSFTAAEPGARLAAATALAATPYFGLVRSTCITALYDNAMAYAHFGYEGPSWDRGGYLKHGFNDLTWLPEPSADASPRVAVR